MNESKRTSEAQEFSAPKIEQMRCVSCRELYPTNQVTYRTGLCQACLAHQLNQLATDYHTIRATFRVLERMLNDGLAAEIKREIYEEIFMPTPEPEAAPTPEPSWICANCETSY